MSAKENDFSSPQSTAEIVFAFHKERQKPFIPRMSDFTPDEWHAIDARAELTAAAFEDKAPHQPTKSLLLDLDSATAKQTFADLHRWNRTTHEKLKAVLEEPFLGVSQRTAETALFNPGLVYDIAASVDVDEIAYSVATLPPTIFDCNDRRPYLPRDPYTLAYLAHATGHYHKKLDRHFANWPLTIPHADLAPTEISLHVFDELVRLTHHQDLSSKKWEQDWMKYRSLFDKHLQKGSLSLFKNALFVSYPKNRDFTQAGGFFEHATKTFDSFLLAETGSEDHFTSQLRVPIGAYGYEFSNRLILAAVVMGVLMQQDKQFGDDIRLKTADKETVAFIKTFVMRANNSRFIDQVYEGSYNTALEAISSVTALLSMLMAEGVPGRDNPDDGLVDIITSKLTSKTTAIMPQAVVVPSSLYGNYFAGILDGAGSDLRVSPKVVGSLMDINNRRNALLHTLWTAHHNNPKSSPPVRLGLHCPFKSAVTHSFTETLVVIYGLLKKAGM